jgi:hypothetical protein
MVNVVYTWQNKAEKYAYHQHMQLDKKQIARMYGA